MKSSVEFRDKDFFKSSFSKPRHKCVEVARKDGVIAVRDSKDPHGAILKFTESEWNAFLAGAKSGEFDS